MLKKAQQYVDSACLAAENAEQLSKVGTIDIGLVVSVVGHSWFESLSVILSRLSSS